jgi:enamine deaminase RidA (YjgF/YER057c/UK114 family)
MSTMPLPTSPAPIETPPAAARQKPAAAPDNCRLAVRETRRETFSEFHVTATVADSGASAGKMLGLVAAALADRGIQPIQEKIYGRAVAREDVLRRRDAAWHQRGLDVTAPVTWIEGRPLHDGDCAGMQVWGVRPHSGEACVRTVENPATGRGRIWTGRGFKMLHLAAVRGTLPDGRLPGGPAAQAAQMFTNVGLGLQAHGMEYPDVARTWIYVSRLLEWYGDLNRVRNAHYSRVGFGGPAGPAFPASTGIQGRMADEECMADILAVKNTGPSGMVTEPIRRSPRQDQSFNYGSAFSRGMTFRIEGRKTVHISGTASINTAGATTHVGDAEGQSLETLLNIAAILEAQGGSLRDITSSTLFCKDLAAWAAWQRVTRLLQLPALPQVRVLADVCRDDLLVEMEAVAVI